METFDHAFEDFARQYPHEAAELDWPRFVALIQREFPAFTEANVRQLLENTKTPEGDR